jgi:hypothetical protein
MTRIWTPKGEYDTGGLELLNRHAQMYDPLLSVGLNHSTGDICIFRDCPGIGQKPIFGWQRVPSLDEVEKKLYEIDTWKHGDSILERAWAEGDKEKEDRERPVQDAIEEAVERIEHLVRKGKA